MTVARSKASPITYSGAVHPGGVTRSIATLMCTAAGCDRQQSLKQTKSLPPEALAQKFKAHGWDMKIGRKRVVCPRCRNKPKEVNDPMSKLTKIPTAKTSAQPVGHAPNPRQQRQIYSLLDEHFREDEGRYLNGYSDQKVSDETGIAVDVIRTCRRQAYGDIKPPSEVAAFQAEVGDLREMVKDLDRRLEIFINAQYRN